MSQQRVSAIENGSNAELATLNLYIHALGGELKVIGGSGTQADCAGRPA
ncbi:MULTISPECIES: hypothetical protein [unclassified Nonomuraea]